MADVLIKNMEMPKACITGELPNYVYCPCFNICSEACGGSERPDACPLVALPEHHGRLIDADFFKEYAVRVHTEEGKEYIPADYIDIVPTILEAST